MNDVPMDDVPMDDVPMDDVPTNDEGDEPREQPRFRVRRVISSSRSRDGEPPRQVSRDETDEGWGDRPAGRDAEWYERERPPHHE